MGTGATAGIIVVLMMFMMGGAGKKRKKKGCPPFEYNEAKVELAIASAISSGKRGPLTIAIVVAKSTWPKHPGTNKAIAWPPQHDAPDDVLCLWDMLLAQIERYMKKNKIPPWPDCPEDLPYFNVAAQECEEPPAPPPEPEPDEPGPFDPGPYETPPTADYPTPGTLMQVRYGDILLGTKSPKSGQGRSIAYTTLLTAGWMAAKEFGGVGDDEAGEFARLVANDNQNRVEYVQLIQCSPWNDALYATFGFGPQSWESPAGRALRFLPQHYDNRTRLMLGKAPRRNIALGTPADKDAGTAFGQNQSERNFAYLWLPKINLQLLWETGGQEVTTEGVSWPDGSNGIMPPPQVVAAYGVENVPGSVAWGCLGYEAQSI